MVMWFNVKKARDYLLKYGFVYTVRPKMRRVGRDMLSYEGFGKKGMVYIIFVKKIEWSRELKDFVLDSGFYDNPYEWYNYAFFNKFLFLVLLL